MNLHTSATIHLHPDISLNMFYVAQHASALAYRLLLLSITSTPCEISEINLSHVPCSSPHCLTKISSPRLRVCTNPIFRGGTYICYTICECYQSHSVLASLRGACYQSLLVSGRISSSPRLLHAAIIWIVADKARVKGHIVQYDQAYTLMGNLEKSVSTSARWNHCRIEYEMTTRGGHRASMKMS